MRFAINGFGRIGRAIFRIAFFDEFDCLYINEPNAEIEDIKYFLKYDSLYGTFEPDIEIDKLNNKLIIKNETKTLETRISHFDNVDEFVNTIPKGTVVIESNGCIENIDYYLNNPKNNAIFTLSSEKIKNEIISGVNDIDVKVIPKNGVVSGSICDTVAIAPILQCVYSCYEIKETLITTMHPALSYQKVIDNYVEPGINRSLGRQYIDSIIPKRTSAEKILKRHFPNNVIRCLSFRIPTESVCAADITLTSNEKIDHKKIIEKLKNIKHISFSYEDVVSIDFKASKSSAIVDMRWFELINDNILKIVIWYDNEYGYSSRILELIKLYFNQSGDYYG